MKELAQIVKSQSVNMDDLSRRYDYGSYAISLRSKFAENNKSHRGVFDWGGFGKVCVATAVMSILISLNFISSQYVYSASSCTHGLVTLFGPICEYIVTDTCNCFVYTPLFPPPYLPST